jgi:hypothetical protein
LQHTKLSKPNKGITTMSQALKIAAAFAVGAAAVGAVAYIARQRLVGDLEMQAMNELTARRMSAATVNRQIKNGFKLSAVSVGPEGEIVVRMEKQMSSKRSFKTMVQAA